LGKNAGGLEHVNTRLLVSDISVHYGWATHARSGKDKELVLYGAASRLVSFVTIEQFDNMEENNDCDCETARTESLLANQWEGPN
jgi:hypothetical protein